MKVKLLFFVIFLFAITSSFAHQPILNSDEEMSPDKPYVIENPEISKAIYSTLEGSDHYYVISSEKPFNFYAGLTVPKINDCDDFLRFSFAVLDNDFHIIQEFDGQKYHWWKWYEPYGKNFKSSNTFDAGTYYIKVYNKDNIGKYVLAVGDIEKFTPAVIDKTLVTLPIINNKFWDKSNCN